MNNIFYLFYYFLIYKKFINTYIRPQLKSIEDKDL